MRKLITRFKRRTIILFILCLCCTVVFLSLMIAWSVQSSGMFIQNAGERYRSENARFAQVSSYYQQGYAISAYDLEAFKETVDKSIESDDKRYLAGYAAFGELFASHENASASCTAIFTGGDWFRIHPLKLLSGSYISADDLMGDRVVIDNAAAWKLFGAEDVAGMTVTIADSEYIVAGVVELESDAFTERAREAENGLRENSTGVIFAPIELAETYSAGNYAFEAVLPEPVTGTAEKTLKGSSLGSGEIIQNTGRFSLGRIWQDLRGVSGRSMRISNTVYPYYENAARLLEARLMLCLILMAVSAVLPVVCALIIIIRYARRLAKLIRRRRTERDAMYGID